MRRFIVAKEDWNDEEYPLDISNEEAEVMAGEANEIANEINSETAEAERMMDVADSLEDMAVVTDQIEEATPAETQLVQIAGDMATAGAEDVDTGEIVPATESLVGRRIASEAFVEKAKEIWENIKAWLKKIWEKVEKFFYKIFGEIPRLRKAVEAAKKRAEDLMNKGASIKSDGKTFELSSGIGAITVNGVAKKKLDEVLTLVGNTKKVIEFAFSTDFRKEMCQKIIDVQGKIMEADSPDGIKMDGLAAKKMTGSVLSKTTSERFNGFDVYASDSDVISGVPLSYRIRTYDEAKKSPVYTLEVYRSAKLEFTNLSNKSPKTPDSVKFETASLGVVDNALDTANELLDVLEKFHRGGDRKKLGELRKDLEKSSDKLSSSIDKMDTDEQKDMLPLARGALKVNVMFTNLCVGPTSQAYNLGLLTVRTLLMLATKSMSQYKA